MYTPENPLIVQSDSTLLLEVQNPRFSDARMALSAFAHLEKSPEYIHSYRITPLSLWNAASLGVTAEDIHTSIAEYSKYPVPENVLAEIQEQIDRFGKIVLLKRDDQLRLTSENPELLHRLIKNPLVSKYDIRRDDDGTVLVPDLLRGVIKQSFIKLGYPIYDQAGYVPGEDYPMAFRSTTMDGTPFHLRAYQEEAVAAFLGRKDLPGGSGLAVLPCGAGKTIIGLKAMTELGKKTLILVSNITAARQWKREILNRTTLTEDEIGEYSGETKEILPITIATYQILTHRKSKKASFLHFDIFNQENWGLIIYDEVHLLPAPVFKYTSEIQARRRLGLTATLIREDGRESDVFALIGPKKYDVPWKDLEKEGWIAAARCIEIRVDLDESVRGEYLSMAPRQQIRTAYENKRKIAITQELLAKHKGRKILILGLYIAQVEEIGRLVGAPVIQGSTPNEERDRLYEEFRHGKISVLVLSKVGNMAIDLPDASVAIQVSGTFGSRQEEAQRLGRILRPTESQEPALFYSIVTRDSKELDFAMNRQLFLAEQGYPYEIHYG
ncbi:DNA repair helicase XPB [Chitinivibrio alkaliphilus]|uniref:DNA 3'-5' helicase n=1 Tax=Chitinivibrio alkaliphilus ACht1 TaxID=1313304 RepID=U7D2Q4_9BACT|nr:DNA repair helicase XPB [Chitinivibrio alkaliphilus]ERP30794.1 DNA repair helicase [Chitinivibrio alkaliphilus ACht1]